MRKNRPSQPVRQQGRYRYLLIALAATMLLAIRGASAAEKEGTAEAYVGQGIEYRKQGLNDQAAERFRHALEQDPASLRIRAHLALALLAAERWVEGDKLLREVLRGSDDPWVIRHKDDLLAADRIAFSHLACIEVDLGEGEGEVWVDGQFASRLPRNEPLRVEAKRTKVEVRAYGRGIVQKDVVLSPGQCLREQLRITPTLPVMSAATSPAVPTHATASKAGVSDSSTKGPDAPRSAIRTTQQVDNSLAASSSSPLRTVGLVSGAAGAVSIVTGSILAITAKAAYDKAIRTCDGTYCGQDELDRERDARDRATLGGVLLGAGVAALAAGAVLYVVFPPARVKPLAVSIQPLSGARTVPSLAISGTF